MNKRPKQTPQNDNVGASSPEPPHIAFLEQYGSLGGGQQMLLELVSAARRANCVATVLIPQGDCADMLIAQKTHVIPTKELILQQGRKRFRDFLGWIVYSVHVFLKNYRTLGQAHLIYVNGARLVLVGALASLFLRKKTVYHIHLLHSRMERLLFRMLLLLPLTQALVVPSSFIRRFFPQADPRIMLVHNGLDSRFSQIKYTDRFKKKPLRNIGIVGRISPEKGQDILLMLAPMFRDMVFHVFGDAAFADTTYCKNLQEKLPPNVVFHGWVNNIVEKFIEQNLQLLLVPSRCAESSSLVTMQGAAMSCLVAVREQGALTSLAKELEIFSFRSDEDMRRLLLKLKNSKDEDMSQKTYIAFHHVMDQYSYSALQKRLTDLFRNLTA